jgi:malate permease and related proteins
MAGLSRDTRGMNEWWEILSAVIPVFAIIGAGLVLRKINWLTEEADHSLLRLNINLLYPCLILDNALGNPALSRPGNLVLAPLVGFGTVGLGIVLCYALSRASGLRDAKARRTFAVTGGIYNYSYIPVPLCLLLFPGGSTVGVLFLHNVGVETALWTLGVMVFTGAGFGRDWRKVFSAPLLAVVLALLLNFLGLSGSVPAAFRNGIHWLGQCAIPMALILIGAVVADHLRDFQADWGWRVIGWAVLLRLVLLPVSFLVLAKYLPASIELKQVIVLEAAMPSAVFPIIMSRHYEGDPPTALRVVIGTSLVGLVTIPLWIRFGLKFVAA